MDYMSGKIFIPHNYQDHAFNHILNNPFCGLFMDMGLGKTVVAETAINRLIYQELDQDRVLIIGPKRVIRSVWTNEANKWSHLQHLKMSIVWGTEHERIMALKKKADVYLINCENVVWLVKLFQSKWPFKFVIIDESSKFKSHRSQRFRALKMIRKHIERMVILTGTPAPNGMLDLWAQLYLLDEGERLEKTISQYRERYFTLKNPTDFFAGYRLRVGCNEAIYNRIGDICISMSKEDYLELPEIIENDIEIDLDDDIMHKYYKFEEDCILEIADKEITAVNAGALNTKLMQFANGAIYHDGKNWTRLHDSKLDALEDIVNESAGQNILVTYSYRHDLERIKERFPHARMLNTPKDEDDWNMGKIRMLIGHPASMGHGLNLQDGGYIVVMFGLTWNLEHYLQVISRLHRQGQLHPVILHRLITTGTIDEDAAKSLLKKTQEQDGLMEAIKARIIKYTGKR